MTTTSVSVLPGALATLPPPPERTVLDVPLADLRGNAERLLAGGFRLALVAAHHDDPAGPGSLAAAAALRVVYLFVAGPPDRRVELRVTLATAAPSMPSLADLSFPAGRFEREIHDLYGVEPVGHPLPRHLVRHRHWPKGWYPMRADAGPRPAFGRPEPFPFVTVEGPGVYEIPVGPVHAGLIEPGHFRFSVVGETILRMKARLWYMHRGAEKLFEGQPATAKIPLAERISGDTAVGHSLAYCQAVEDACGIDVPAEARRARAVLLELERIYNHVADLGMLCNDVGHGILNAHAQRLRERLLRLNAQVTGHRLLRTGVVISGARLDYLPSAAELDSVAADTTEIVTLALRNGMVRDRFAGTAVLNAKAASDLGTLGYVARASGLPYDARVSHPQLDLTGLLRVPTHPAGDVMARFLIRADEIEASVGLLRHLVPTLRPGEVVGDTSALAAATTEPRSGVGIVEAWRGALTHRVEIGADGLLTRVKIVDPSFFNWPALPVALTGTIVPDFPLANKSFNQSYAGNDL